MPINTLPDSDEPELIEAAERGQVNRREGSVGHVEVFQVESVGTPILGRPRPLPEPRRATRRYTLVCEEPVRLMHPCSFNKSSLLRTRRPADAERGIQSYAQAVEDGEWMVSLHPQMMHANVLLHEVAHCIAPRRWGDVKKISKGLDGGFHHGHGEYSRAAFASLAERYQIGVDPQELRRTYERFELETPDLDALRKPVEPAPARHFLHTGDCRVELPWLRSAGVEPEVDEGIGAVNSEHEPRAVVQRVLVEPSQAARVSPESDAGRGIFAGIAIRPEPSNGRSAHELLRGDDGNRTRVISLED